MYSFYNPRALRVMADFKYTQEEDIFNQLAYGIRCLDLRISASGPVNNPKYRIAHDVLTGDASVVEVLQQVKDFIRVSSHGVRLWADSCGVVQTSLSHRCDGGFNSAC